MSNREINYGEGDANADRLGGVFGNNLGESQNNDFFNTRFQEDYKRDKKSKKDKEKGTSGGGFRQKLLKKRMNMQRHEDEVADQIVEKKEQDLDDFVDPEDQPAGTQIKSLTRFEEEEEQILQNRESKFKKALFKRKLKQATTRKHFGETAEVDGIESQIIQQHIDNEEAALAKSVKTTTKLAIFKPIQK